MKSSTGSARGTGPARPAFLIYSIILAACATISCLLIAILGSRYHTRIDLSTGGEFTLSPRTLAVLRGVTEPTTLVVSADLGALDRATRLRMSDLLDEFARESPMIRPSWIDTASAGAAQDFSTLIGSLASPHASMLAEQRAQLGVLADESAAIAESLRGLSDGLKSIGDSASLAPTARTNASDQAGFVRTIAAALDALPSSLRTAAGHALGGVSLPAVDQAREEASEPLARAGRAAGAIAEYAAALGATDGAAALAERARSVRDRTIRAADALARLRSSDPLIVARVLEQTSAIIVTSSKGAIALDFATLFPSSAAAEPASADPRDTLFKGEQMISTALGALTQPAAPIAVFVHAQPVRLLDEHGEPTPPALGAFRRLFDRLRLTRTTPAEWAVALDPLRPDLGAINPTGARPVVWIVLGAPPRTQADPRQSSAGDRRTRISALGNAVRTLVDSGAPMLLCIEPSDLPSVGDPDPISAAVEPLGFTIDSARPIVRREASPQGAMIWMHHAITASSDAHPISTAIGGTRLVMPWCSAIEPHDVPGTTLTPLLSLPHEGTMWGEAQWTALRDLVGRGLAPPLGPLMLAEPPGFDALRDRTVDGAVTVALAAERATPGGGPPARCMVVASPEWLHDVYTQASEEVTGRRVSLFPGNLELFDASLAWLAGRDDQIAAGPRTMDSPRIGAIGEGPLRSLRLLLIVGVPALPLILGALLRLWRG